MKKLWNKTTAEWKEGPWTSTLWSRHSPTMLEQYTDLVHDADLLLALPIKNFHFKVSDLWMFEGCRYLGLASREHKLREVEKRAWVLVGRGGSFSPSFKITLVFCRAEFLPPVHGATQRQQPSSPRGTVAGESVSSLCQLNTTREWWDRKGQVAFHFQSTVLFSRTENNGSVIQGYI